MSDRSTAHEFASNEDPRVRRVELTISNLLRIGVAVSVTLIVLGTIITFAQHPSYLRSSADEQRIVSPNAIFSHSLRDLAAGLTTFKGDAVVVLGLLVLIATPIARVAVSILAFIYQDDRVFTLITMAVLCLLILSLVLGKAG